MRMFKIKWLDWITNQKVFNRFKENRTLWKNLRKRGEICLEICWMVRY